MPKNKIEDLRNHLFQSLEELSDEEAMKNPIKREKVIAIADAKAKIAKEINASAALEIKFMDMVGGKSNFIQLEPNSKPKEINP